jgi:hypothetical protein
VREEHKGARADFAFGAAHHRVLDEQAQALEDAQANQERHESEPPARRLPSSRLRGFCSKISGFNISPYFSNLAVVFCRAW